MRKMKRSVLLTLATVVVSLGFSHPTSAAMIIGVGNQECAKFNEKVRNLVVAPNNLSWEEYSYAWAQGWLSRKNVEREARGVTPVPDLLPEGFGPKDQMAFMRAYCASNPQKDYVYGVEELFRKLLQMYSLSV
jgi:hypothetical protein